jgi:hypothetical protein
MKNKLFDTFAILDFSKQMDPTRRCPFYCALCEPISCRSLLALPVNFS